MEYDKSSKRSHEDNEVPRSPKRSRESVLNLTAEILDQNVSHVNNLHKTVYTTRYSVHHNLNLINSADQLNEVSSELTEMYKSFVKPTVDAAEPWDYISVTVEHDKLNLNGSDKPIYLSYVRASKLRYTDFVDKVSSVVQSNETFLLDGVLRVVVRKIKNLRGSAQPSKNTVRDTEEFYNSKRSVILLNNTYDDLCGYYCLGLGRWLVENPGYKTRNSAASKEWKQYRKNFKEGEGRGIYYLAMQIKNELSIKVSTPLSISMLPKIQKHYEGDFQIIVLERPQQLSHNINKLFVGANTSDDKVILEYENNNGTGHFNLITSMNQYHGKDSYCWRCMTAYDRRDNHVCDFLCKHCRQSPPCEEEEDIRECSDCGLTFAGLACYNKHLGTKLCTKQKLCKRCNVRVPARHLTEHDCSKFYCIRCNDWYEHSPHYCHIRPTDKDKLIEQDEKLKINVFFDIEAYMGKKQSIGCAREKYQHIANLLVAHVTCDGCWNYTTASRPIDCSTCGKEEYVFSGVGCVEEFCDLLYKVLCLKAGKSGKVYVYSHNFKAYDGHFVVADLIKRRPLTNNIIMAGTKIMKLKIGNIIYQDSLNYFQQPLAKLPESFGFKDKVVKGEFCHDWNQPRYFGYVGPVPPLPSNRHMLLMKVNEAQKLRDWHKHLIETNYVFDFDKELLTYCRADVMVLKLAMQEFRNLFKDITGLDPTTRCCTLAGIALEVYRSNHLKPDTIGVTPIAGYNQRKSSFSADTWLDMVEKRDGIKIHREFRIGNKWADGYCKETKTAYEFNGCKFHGCPRCCTDPNKPIYINGRDKKPIIPRVVYQKFIEKTNLYKRLEIKLVTMWECDFKHDHLKAPEMMYTPSQWSRIALEHFWILSEMERRKRIRKELGDDQHCNIRESFFGGRTNNLYFDYECQADEHIEYSDFTSLYPWVLKTLPYPVGHPTIITHSFKEISEYFGFIKCRIRPSNCFIPMLGKRIDGKLCFPSCNTCATKKEVYCTHDEAHDRSLTGTWTTPEITSALKHGYVIDEIYEVLHYEQQSDDLFCGYIKDWLKIKTESSGWPANVSTFEQKDEYIEAFREREGIDLDYEMIVKNQGRRSIAKLMLNSLWGKLAERANQPKTEIIADYAQQMKLVSNEKYEVMGEMEVYKTDTDATVIMSYRMKNEEDCDPRSTSVAVASFVTAYGRLKLLDQIVEIESSRADQVPNYRTLYFDTDSVIYKYKPSVDKPLPTGNFLGDLTDEVLGHTNDPNAKIIRFYAMGPKAYSYIIKYPDGREEQITKCKGITLNGHTKVTFREDRIKAIISDHLTNKEYVPITIPQFNIRSDIHTAPYTTIGPKISRPTGDKRFTAFDDPAFNKIRGDNKVTLPYGFQL